LSHSTSTFYDEFFWDRVSQTIFLGLALNHDPPNLSSWVARITGVSQQRPASLSFWSSISSPHSLRSCYLSRCCPWSTFWIHIKLYPQNFFPNFKMYTVNIYLSVP
jgi:hypothetical protein